MYELKLQYGAVFECKDGDKTISIVRVERKKTKQPGRGNRTRKIVRFYRPQEYAKLTESNSKR